MEGLLGFNDAHFRHYVYLNLGVASGIAADAMIATLSRFSSFPDGRTALKWGSAIGITHWLFPLVGFIGGWYAAVNTPMSTAVYVFGALVMTWFVKEVVREAAGLSEDDDDEDERSGIWTSRTHFWAAVWGVSIDALVTGPGKTSATAGWSVFEVWLSFPIVGFVVFVLVMCAAYVAMLLRRKYAAGAPGRAGSSASDARDRWRLGLFFTVGTWFEVVIFSYFGLLAVAQTLRLYGIPVGDMLVFGAAGSVGAVLFMALHKRVREQQKRRAAAAFRV